MFRFCPERGFFHPEINSDIPEHAVEVTQERHAELMREQSAGAQIVAGEDGQPICIARAGPTVEQLWRAVRRERNERLAASDWTQLPDAPVSRADRALCAAYRAALRDLPQTQADPTSIVWPPIPAFLDR